MEKEIILITGGDGNIARATVRKYLACNCKVIAVDIKTNCDLEEFNQNENYEYYYTDVTNINQLQDLYKKLAEKYRRITHIVSAIGHSIGTERDGFCNTTIEDINQSILLNLNSHIYVIKTFLPLLKKEINTNKSIALVSSINAMKSFNLPAYSAAKAGLYGFMYGTVREFGKMGIRINTVSPGTVPPPEDLSKGTNFHNYKYKQMLILEGFTTPEAVADTIYSVTHIIKSVTGQNLVVDSGQIL